MNTESPTRYSSLYFRLRLCRIAIPLLAAIGVLLFEIFEHGLPFAPLGWTPVVDILVFGIIGPTLTFLVLTWLLHRVAERDDAEARLAVVSARERELLSQLERSVRAERFGLAATLEGIVAALCTETSMTQGAIYLLNERHRELLPPTVSWPSAESGKLLAQVAQNTLLEGPAGRNEREGTVEGVSVLPGQRILTVPITDRGETLGLLVLSGPAECAPPDRGVLALVAGAIALLVRNNQLYTRLESQAVIEERNEMAREVHDGIAQSLGYLNFKAQQVKRLLDRGRVGEAGVALDELCEGSREAYDEVRFLIRSLRFSSGIGGGLVSNLQQYTALLARRTGLEIKVDAAAEPNLSPEAQLQLFRTAQEALSNAHKHAVAHKVRIRLTEGPDCLTLTVQDDGLGLPAPRLHADESRQARDSLAVSVPQDPDGGFGLHIMRERVQSIGGELQIESRPGEGTTVRVQVPAGCFVPPSEEVAGASERQ